MFVVSLSAPSLKVAFNVKGEVAALINKKEGGYVPASLFIEIHRKFRITMFSGVDIARLLLQIQRRERPEG